MALRVPRTLASGRYTLSALRVADPLGESWTASDGRTGASVVVKFLSWGAGANPPGRQGFAAEARALVDQPLEGGVRLDALALEGRLLYLVADAAEHVGLDAAIAAQRALEPADAAAVLDAILATLERAHARGLVLRELCPSAVLLGPDNGVRLSWFGALSVSDPPPGLAPARFRAPGQDAQLAVADPAWDLHAAGQLLFAMITGEAPESPPLVADVDAALGPALAPLYLRATARAGGPPATATELRGLLSGARDQLGAGKLLSELAPPPAPPPVVRPTAIGHRQKAGLALIATAGLLVGLGLVMGLDLLKPAPPAAVAAPSPVVEQPAVIAEPAAEPAEAQDGPSGGKGAGSSGPPPLPAGPRGKAAFYTLEGAARVVVHGGTRGTTPVTLELPVGRNAVTLVSPGGERAKAVITVDPEQTTSFCWSFEADAPCTPLAEGAGS